MYNVTQSDDILEDALNTGKESILFVTLYNMNVHAPFFLQV